jgi:hypothetical protein
MAAASGAISTAQQITVNKTIFGQIDPIVCNFGIASRLSAGSGANAYQNVYADTRTITSGVADSIDLTNSSLTDPTGATVNFADVILLGFAASASNVGNITIGAGAGAMSSILGASGTVTLPPGATVLFVYPAATGYSVANHKIQATSAIGSAVYDVLVVGH